jgi:ribose 5-phosphate isomerase B
MKIVLAADHAGFEIKNVIREHLKSSGHQVTDLGVNSTDPADYPDCAESLGLRIVGGAADRGILVCGSGIGAVIAANKIPGVRAGLAHDTYSARQGVEHDAMNVLVLGGRIIGSELAKELVNHFLSGEFHPEERYVRRLDKVHVLEEKFGSRLK